MSTPGYQPTTPKSSSGWGRNISFTALSSGLQANQTSVYSYPDPAVNNVSGPPRYISSGFTKVDLVGQYFSNARPTAFNARMGVTTCAKTFWYSHTTVTCIQSPSHGAIYDFALTIDRSAVATFRSLAQYSAVAAVSNISIEGSTLSALTSSTVISVWGAGFGMRDFSVRLRLTVGSSGSAAMLWLSNSQISAKIPLVVRNPGIQISLAHLVKLPAFPFSALMHSPTISTCNRTNVPSTGAAIISVTGLGFGLYSVSMRSSLRGSGSQATRWTSFTVVQLKAPSGVRVMSSPLLLATVANVQSGSFGANIQLAYNAPVVNVSAKLMANNSEECAFKSPSPNSSSFNSSSCEAGHLFQMVQGSSGFGCDSFSTSLSVKQLPERAADECTKSLWISDSAIYCLYNDFIFKNNLDISLLIIGTPSELAFKNVYFVPASPEISNETIKIRVYDDSRLDRNLVYFGSRSAFAWPDSTVSTGILFSDTIRVSVAVFLNANQFFLDTTLQLKPIATFMVANVSVRNSSTDRDIRRLSCARTLLIRCLWGWFFNLKLSGLTKRFP
jgi:hypothetical protein